MELFSSMISQTDNPSKTSLTGLLKSINTETKMSLNFLLETNLTCNLTDKSKLNKERL